MAYIKAHHAIKSVNLARASLPMDTGNLRFNGTKYGYSNRYFHIDIGGEAAPYFEHLQEKEYFWNKGGPTDVKNPYYKNFEKRTFAPVYNYLKFALKGKFGGGRFLVQKTMSAKQAQTVVERTIDANLLRREQVYNMYSGGR